MRFRSASLIALAAASIAPAAAAPTHYSASIVRTRYGIPHITAATIGGAGYGAGYTAAEDNGCIIAEELVTLRGERSKYFGKDGRVTIGFQEISNFEADVYHRTIGDLPALRRAMAATSADNRALIAGFVAGYNRYLRDHGDKLAASCRGAAWVRPASADDGLLLVNGAMTLIGSAPYAAAIAAAVPPGPATSASGPGLPVAADRIGLGSNGWAFGGDATANGRGMVVGNPHFPWNGPNRFRRLHMTVPGKLDVEGAGLVFSPLVSIGFNRDVAWTHTVTTAQHVTLFQLKTDPADPTRYFVDGKPERMTTRAVTIDVKDGAPVTRTLYATRFGPVVAMPAAGLSWVAAQAFALRDADQGNLRSGDAWLGMDRAHSVAEIRHVISTTLGVPWVNTIAADRAGNAMYADVTAVPNVSAAKLAACAAPAGKALADRGVFVLDGTRAACDWDVARATPVPGLMPADKMAVLVRRDWVQNSNNSYWLTNPATPFPQLSPLLGSASERQSLRTRSGIQVLQEATAAGKVDQPKAAALILGNRVLAAEMALDDLLKLCPSRPALADACKTLAAWDRHAETSSKGAVLFFAFWRQAATLKDLWAVPFDPKDPVHTPRTLNTAGAGPAILDALHRAVDQLAQFKVPLDAPLGLIQIAPRGADRIPIHGGPGVAGILNVMESLPTPQGLVPVHGSSYMQVVTWDAAGPQAWSMLSYSQSADPASPHSADATRAFSAKDWLHVPFTPAEIEAQREGPTLRIAE